MTAPGHSQQRNRHDPFVALRQRHFLLYALGRLGSGTGAMLLVAAIAWQVYDISGSAWQLGMIGLVRFIPSLGLGLVGGAVADAFDRRRITMAAQGVVLGAGAVLLGATLAGSESLPLIYAVAFVVSVAAAFEAPARGALLPSVVTPAAFPNAIVVSGTAQQLGFVTGPAIAGAMIALSGPGLAYGVYCGLLGGSLVALAALRPRKMDVAKRAVGVTAIRQGISFVWHRHVLLGAMTLDMFAVIFGGATALLPIYAHDILDVGPVGYGLLYGSLDLGALLMSVSLVVRPPIQRAGRALLVAVFLFGVGTIVFGLSRSFPLSLAACMFIGMADQVSVVMRQTTVQINTPDDLRGRVTSVNMLFIGASNQLGAVESGFVAAITSATFAVVSGGAGCLAVLAVVAAKLPELGRYRVGQETHRAAAIDPGEPSPPPEDAPAPAQS